MLINISDNIKSKADSITADCSTSTSMPEDALLSHSLMLSNAVQQLQQNIFHL